MQKPSPTLKLPWRAAGMAVIAGITVLCCSVEGPAFLVGAAPQAAEATVFASGPLGAETDGGAWLNASPGGPDLRGKVVLVNFWTYSCINSIRPLAHLRAWAARYADRGLVVVGVHSPEFGFEKEPAKVAGAVADLELSWPVLLDPDHSIWKRFRNDAWPGFYLIDAEGRIRQRALGEGNFERIEQEIRELLAERDGQHPEDEPTRISGKGIEAAADWAELGSPETYLGPNRSERFAGPGRLLSGPGRTYASASHLPLNGWDLSGEWSGNGEFTESTAAKGALRYRFHARDLHIVMGRAEGSAPISFRVTVDGEAPGIDHGVDIDAEGWGELREDRLYQLVRQNGTVRDRVFRIEFQQAGARAYAITFG